MRGLKALAINPVDRTAVSVITAKAKARNVPVIFFNREPTREDRGKWDKVYYVGARAEQPGTVLGVLACWQQIIKGIIIVLAVSIDIRKHLRRR